MRRSLTVAGGFGAIRNTEIQKQSTHRNQKLTCNIASPESLSALQNWHDGVNWDSLPPLIASDEGMLDR